MLSQAFRSVRHNRGCASVDIVTIRNFEDKLDLNLRVLEDEADREVYSPLPLMKILMAKKNGEPRGLCIPPDRIVQKSVLNCIERIIPEADGGEFSLTV